MNEDKQVLLPEQAIINLPILGNFEAAVLRIALEEYIKDKSHPVESRNEARMMWNRLRETLAKF